MKQPPALRSTRIPVLCLAALCLLAGTACDPLRAFLDMPTRARVQSLRAEAALQQTRIQDSLQAASAADSLARVPADSLAAGQTGSLAHLPADSLAAGQGTQRFWRYYLVAGSFRLEENARQLVERLQKNGFEAQTLLFRSGSTVVTVGGYDSYEPAAARMAELAPLPLFADGLWLYNSRRALHIE